MPHVITRGQLRATGGIGISAPGFLRALRSEGAVAFVGSPVGASGTAHAAKAEAGACPGAALMDRCNGPGARAGALHTDAAAPMRAAITAVA